MDYDSISLTSIVSEADDSEPVEIGVLPQDSSPELTCISVTPPIVCIRHHTTIKVQFRNICKFFVRE